MTETEIQARSILNSLIEIPFSACIPITRSFERLTPNPGIYAVRHRVDGLLYVGKAQDIRERFRGGHKALTWSWLADYDHRDVAIAAYPIDFMRWRALSSELERIILQITEPPFNARIPTRES
jgi:excinuclease UvrABC nuclease subunit